jgi:spermidine/putrescine ABC transporter ATP-binding subunit
MTRSPATDGAALAAHSPAVQVAAVSRRFSTSALAVDRVSLEVAPGEFLCLLGPSGSGKTTLLRIIGGFERPDEGRVYLQGQEVTHQPPAQRRTNMVFQHHALFPHLNVRDNVAFGLRMRRTATAEVVRRVRQALELVRLTGFDSRSIEQLSGGQRQRVAIARAIVNEPAVLLLDEPLGALDLRLRVELQNELRRLQRSLGSPFIVVTHDQGEAMAMSDRIAVINDGRIEQVGTPDEIYNQPASLFVARFVGHTNLLSGRIESSLGGGNYRLRVGGVLIPCHASQGLSVGCAVTVSVREEMVRLEEASEREEEADYRIEGTVIDRTFLGSLVKYTVRLSDDLTVVAEVPAPAMAHQWDIGRRVRVAWRTEQTPAFILG